MKNTKHIFALFYVSLILLFKVAGLHALTHHSDDADDQHCEVCHITTAVNFTPLIEAETPVVPETESYFLEEKFNNYTSTVVFNNRYLSSDLKTRPPPQLS